MIFYAFAGYRGIKSAPTSALFPVGADFIPRCRCLNFNRSLVSAALRKYIVLTNALGNKPNQTINEFYG